MHPGFSHARCAFCKVPRAPCAGHVAPFPKSLGVLQNAPQHPLNVLHLAWVVSCTILSPCTLSILLHLPSILQKRLMFFAFCCLQPAFQEMRFLDGTVCVTERAGCSAALCTVHVPNCAVRFAARFARLDAVSATKCTAHEAFARLHDALS